MVLRATTLTALLLVTLPHEARGQCASKVSSCTRCHETEGRASIRDDGAPWHEDHAIGDFCAGCHGGNAEAERKDEAHAGLAPPLADVDRSCAACHAEGRAELLHRYVGPRAIGPQRKLPPPSPRSRNGLVGALSAATAIAGGVIVLITERRRRALAAGGGSP